MVSSVLVGISSTAALGVWNQAAALVHDTASMEQADDLEMLRLATHRWLAQHAENNVQLHDGSGAASGMWLPLLPQLCCLALAWG